MTVADSLKRGNLPGWFVWLHMVATLTLAAVMSVCSLTGYWAWAIVIWLTIQTIWIVDLRWKLNLLTSDRAVGAINERQYQRERLASFASFVVAPVITTAILVIMWNGQIDLQRRLSPPAQHMGQTR